MTLKFKPAREKAQLEIDKLQRAREQLDERRSSAARELFHLQAQLPGALADGLLADSADSLPADEIDKIHRSIQAQKFLLAHADKADFALVTRLEDAHRSLLEIEARQTDVKADQAEERLRQHTQKVEALLQQLHALEGVHHCSLPWHERQMLAVMLRDGKSTIGSPVAITQSVSDKLAAEVIQHRTAANQIRSRAPRSHGRAMGYTLQELLREIRVPGVIGPSEASVRLWMESAQSAAMAKWNQSGDGLTVAKDRGYTGTRCAFAVAWKNGVIASGTAKIEATFKTITVSTEQELVGGAAYGL